MAFCTTKTYFSLETSLGLFGLIAIYAVLDIFGLVYIWKYLPETERRTLEEIELHFSDNDKKMSDIKIRKNVNMSLEKSQKAANGCENKGFESSPWEIEKYLILSRDKNSSPNKFIYFLFADEL